MRKLKILWDGLLDFFEYGDLVPFLVIVSAVHYAVILSGKDFWIVAVAIGMLVDLGHFRTIRAAFRYGGDDRRQLLARWLIALVMTGISLAYHQRYYNDFWLSAPIPFLIAALAWLQKVDRRTNRIDAEPKKRDASITVLDAPHMQALPAHVCASCGETFASQQKLAAHMRWQHQPAATATPRKGRGRG